MCVYVCDARECAYVCGRDGASGGAGGSASARDASPLAPASPLASVGSAPYGRASPRRAPAARALPLTPARPCDVAPVPASPRPAPRPHRRAAAAPRAPETNPPSEPPSPPPPHDPRAGTPRTCEPRPSPARAVGSGAGAEWEWTSTSGLLNVVQTPRGPRAARPSPPLPPRNSHVEAGRKGLFSCAPLTPPPRPARQTARLPTRRSRSQRVGGRETLWVDPGAAARPRRGPRSDDTGAIPVRPGAPLSRVRVPDPTETSVLLLWFQVNPLTPLHGPAHTHTGARKTRSPATDLLPLNGVPRGVGWTWESSRVLRPPQRSRRPDHGVWTNLGTGAHGVRCNSNTDTKHGRG